jgi:hypothetical protein
MIGTLAIVAFAFLVGVFVGALVLAIFASGDRQPECPQCHGGKVVIYAGDLERDDGYCELKMCSTCDDGRRIGRSDVPIVTAPAPQRPGGHLREVQP